MIETSYLGPKAEIHYETDAALPGYVRAARELHQILAEMQVNQRLKPERELCVTLGISRVTLRRSLEYFHKQGFLEVRPGRGTWLVQAIPPLSIARKPLSRLIGLVIPSVQHPFISRIVHGAEKHASDHGFHLALAHDHNDSDYQLKQLRRMAESDAGGIAVYPDANNLQREEFLALLQSINERDIPLVMIDRYAPEIAAACVLSDNFRGSYMAAQHLILNGHRKLGMLSFGPEGGVTDQDRRKGFIAALEDYGINPYAVRDAALGTRNHEVSAQEVVGQWLADNQGRPSFDGLVCMQDNMAYGAYLALREAGLRVPEDVALIGYDNIDRELFQTVGLTLTSIDQPAEKIGAEAARLLIDKIEKRDVDVRDSHLLLKPRLIVRGSCGSDPRHSTPTVSKR